MGLAGLHDDGESKTSSVALIGHSLDLRCASPSTASGTAATAVLGDFISLHESKKTLQLMLLANFILDSKWKID